MNRKKAKKTKAELVRAYVRDKPDMPVAEVIKLIWHYHRVKVTPHYVHVIRWEMKKAKKKAQGRRKATPHASATGFQKAYSSAVLENAVKASDGLKKAFFAAPSIPLEALDKRADKASPATDDVAMQAEKQFMGLVVQLGLIRARHVLDLVEKRLGEIG